MDEGPLDAVASKDISTQLAPPRSGIKVSDFVVSHHRLEDESLLSRGFDLHSSERADSMYE